MTEAEAPATSATATPSDEISIEMTVEDRILQVFAEHFPYM
jgi:hypothetical protein